MVATLPQMKRHSNKAGSVRGLQFISLSVSGKSGRQRNLTPMKDCAESAPLFLRLCEVLAIHARGIEELG
jgi:hypothetical protein